MFAVLVIAACKARARHAGILVLGLALVFLLAAIASGVFSDTTVGVLLGGLGRLSGLSIWLWILLALIFGGAGFVLLFARENGVRTARLLVSGAVLLAADRLRRLLGASMVAAIEKLMGLVLSAIAVEMILAGLKRYFVGGL